MEKLENVLERTIDLLVECKHADKALWFKENLQRLRDEGRESSTVVEVAVAIRSILAGMGSFSDLSLIPSSESRLSVRDAHQLQWNLAEEMDSITEEVLREERRR